MIVYRVENDEGEGPFVGHTRDEFDRVGHPKNAALWFDGPSPQAEAIWHPENLGFTMYGHVCGVATLDMLSRWFPRPAALALLGYTLTAWEVNDDDLYLFDHQVAFPRRQATRLGTHPIPMNAREWETLDTIAFR